MFFTILIPIFLFSKHDKEEFKGIGFICAIMSFFMWLAMAGACLNLTYDTVYHVSATAYVHTQAFTDSWVLTLVFILCSIPSLIFILYLIPESWRGTIAG